MGFLVDNRIGTCHFVTFDAAVRYYEPYGYNSEDVSRKLAAGEICIGRPRVHSSERCEVNSEGRYEIWSAEA